MPGLEGRVIRKRSMPVKDLLGQGLLGMHAKAYLVKENTEAVVLKKFPVVRRIVVHAIQRLLKAFYHHSPPAVSFAKVDGPVHGRHALLQQPMLPYIEKQVGSLLVVDAVEEPDAANRAFITFCPVLLIGKGGNPAYQGTIGIF